MQVMYFSNFKYLPIAELNNFSIFATGKAGSIFTGD
jgi:hypothetical protein